MAGLEPDPQSPFGGFLQGATHGVSLAMAVQNQKRAVEDDRQKAFIQLAELRQTLGSRADAIIHEIAPDLAPALLQSFPAQSAEERNQLTVPQAQGLGFSPSVAGMSPMTMQGAGAILRGQAAKSQAQTAWDALMRGDTKGMNDAADKAAANATALETHALTAFFATPEDKALAISQAQEANQEAARYRNLALLMTKRGGGLTLKEIQGQGFLPATLSPQPAASPTTAPRRPNEAWDAYKARTGG